MIMEATFKKVTDFLDEQGAPYKILEHEPVFTSEQAAKIRGTSLKQGAKALLFKSKENFILIVAPGDKRVDSKKLKKLLGTKDLRFATPEEVKQVMGCEIGACYPFGNLIGVRMIVDKSVGKNEIISFNAGLHNRSVLIKYADYEKAVNPEVVDIT
jgi:Ala-tRNA(Pro) deacylase